jgi:hypothetical protein
VASKWMRGRAGLCVCAALALGLTAGGAASAPAQSSHTRARARAAAPAAASSQAVRLTVLSTRADLVSGGEALVQAVLPPGARPSQAQFALNGRNVTSTFAVRANGKFEGLMTGLVNGANALTATLPGGDGARLKITNHPIGGPVFSGPEIQPWACQQGATDAQCNQAPTYAYYYAPAGTSGISIGTNGVASASAFQSYDPSNPPPASAIATTTTTDGVTVPFIVRQETGYIDRDQYAIATLFQPGKPWAPWAPQSQYNGRLVITHGASCDTTYGTGAAPTVLDPKLLGGGFVVMSNALDNAGHNCNLVTEAESLEMTKEWVVDHYGEIRWTIGSGCSGGSLVQQQVANAYPGIYQGITPQCSFTDAWSSSMEYEDYYMLLNYFKTKDQADGFTPLQISSVIDHPNPANPVTFTTAIPNSGQATRSCPDVPAADVYDPQTNPHGVRCTLEDYMLNLFGRRASDGFANRPFDNVGIQYGLAGLRQGVITPQQFADLNAHLGGLDINGNFSAQRSTADPVGLQRAYTDGAVDEANNLNQVAIIDLRGPDPGAFHDVYRTYAMRNRLLRNFGSAANQVLWRGQDPLIGDVNYADQAVYAVDGWLGRVYSDPRDVPLATKIVQDKPDTVADRCTDGNGTALPETACDQTVSAYGTPRFAADEPKTDDVMKCRLKPLVRSDYAVTFTDAQWHELQTAFPNGVCDYSKPGVGQGPTTGWVTYQDAAGHVVYGGTPMGPAPASAPFALSGSCGKLSGRIAGLSLGPVRLGMPRARARGVFPRFSTRRREFMDFLCPAADGIRVGYPSSALLRPLSRAERRRVQGRVVLALTANPNYALRGVTPGRRLAAVARRLHVGKPFHIGLNLWYLAPAGRSRAVLKVRHGIIGEIGVANRQLTSNRRAARRFLSRFS